MKLVYVVDWDGTLIEDGHYPEMGKWLPGAVEALHELLEHGEVLIYTMRVSPYEQYHDGDEAYRRPGDDIDFQLSSIYDMLDAEGLHEVKVHTTKGKPAGTYYIDNQAIEFTNWGKVLTRILGEAGLRDHGTVGEVASRERPVSPNIRGLDRVLAGVDQGKSGEHQSVDALAKGASPAPASIREFPSGATRDTDDGKLDFEGFFSPSVLERRAQFMHKHRIQADGRLRASDNWQRGIPLDAYMKSAWRHFFSWWQGHRSNEDVQEEICALMFNCEGYLAELLKASTSSVASESPAP